MIDKKDKEYVKELIVAEWFDNYLKEHNELADHDGYINFTWIPERILKHVKRVRR